MSNIAIKVENLSKAYQLGQIGTGTISRDLERWYAKIRGKEDPFLRIGESNNQNTKSENNVVWSLNDINFEIEQGDAVGIIGRNGAGKSTLLKILSKVTAPTTGKISGKGRIASLLEVGTGFHPELSGRENIFLNGAILGMRKKEIQRKLDEIVDFAGIERYLDTPVKRYSSGMYVRLAFAVAAHLESEILIVDEVLAVGDAEFQTKCLGKMGEISQGAGKTVLFVSHNMSAVQKLCSNGIFLMNGEINHIGPIDQTINRYLNINNKLNSTYHIPSPVDENILGYVSKIIIENKDGEPTNEILVGQYWQVRIIFKLNKAVEHFIIALGITNNFNVDIRTTWSKKQNLNTGIYEAVFREDQLFLASGEYNITVGLSTFERVIHYVEGIAKINISDVVDPNIHMTILRTSGSGIILNPMAINITKYA